jgi:hypothetical protein
MGLLRSRTFAAFGISAPEGPARVLTTGLAPSAVLW